MHQGQMMLASTTLDLAVKMQTRKLGYRCLMILGWTFVKLEGMAADNMVYELGRGQKGLHGVSVDTESEHCRVTGGPGGP